MRGNGTYRKNNRHGSNTNSSPRLPGWRARGLPSALAAACLATATLGLAACSGPASSQPGSANPGTVSVRSSGRMTPMPAPSASAANSTGEAAPLTQPSTAPAASRTQPRIASERYHLNPGQLPSYTVESWTAQAPGPVNDMTGHAIQLNECSTVHGAATWQQQPYLSSGGNPAILETFTFATSAAARSAYATVLSGMRSCRATSRALQTASHITPDAVSRQTASATDAVAFERIWTGVMGMSAAGPQVNHLYLAMRGTTVLVLHFDELGKQTSPYDVRNDPGVLSTLTHVLTAQGGAG